MAIQVSGTTVIDDSRNLVNVIGLKTVNSTSLLGAGDIAAGASTTYGAVGTYIMAIYRPSFVTPIGTSVNVNGYGASTTYAGSDLSASGLTVQDTYDCYGATNTGGYRSAAIYWMAGGTTVSGTWRLMGQAPPRESYGLFALYVRTV